MREGVKTYFLQTPFKDGQSIQMKTADYQIPDFLRYQNKQKLNIFIKKVINKLTKWLISNNRVMKNEKMASINHLCRQ